MAKRKEPHWPTILKALRVKLGTEDAPLNQAQAAALINSSLRSWNGWEAGSRPVPKPVQIILRLMEALPAEEIHKILG